MVLSLSNKQARAVILSLQGLMRPPDVELSYDDLLELIIQLGFVQVDSIRWVERAQHMTLFARNQNYRPVQLAHLIENKKDLFEGWTHDASIIPSVFYPYWQHRFERHKENIEAKFQRWQGEECLSQCDELINRIKQNGGIRSRDLDRDQKQQSSAPKEMWQWHDGKAALEFLWRTGKLAIIKREGFQKVYDLSNRAIKKKDFNKQVSDQEFIDWVCNSALERLGFGSVRDIAKYWDVLSISEVKQWLEGRGKGKVIEVQVTGVGGAQPETKLLFGRKDLSKLVAALEQPLKRLRILSPFDPVIRDRKRLEWLFGFEYRIEIYVPEAKRKWGYYVFPILEGDQLIGRIDMRAKRKEGILEIKRVWLQDGVSMSKARFTRLNAELKRQSQLCGMAKIVWLEGAY